MNTPRNNTQAAGTSVPTMARRVFFNHQFVYCVISQRARGLSIGINMNPDQYCNFDCVYCEIDHSVKRPQSQVNVEVMIEELQEMLEAVRSGSLSDMGFQGIPEELLELREVALSGSGEPTLCPNFYQVVEPVVQLRALGLYPPPFKIVLITNCTGLHLPEVQEGIMLLGKDDEVWAKLDAGSQKYMEEINRTSVPLKLILKNILHLARKRPVIIQSLFASINGWEPPFSEIDQFAQRLRELKEAGANIPLVQIYSSHRPVINRGVAHLPLRTLSNIAKHVREVSGLTTEVF